LKCIFAIFHIVQQCLSILIDSKASFSVIFNLFRPFIEKMTCFYAEEIYGDWFVTRLVYVSLRKIIKSLDFWIVPLISKY